MEDNSQLRQQYEDLKPYVFDLSSKNNNYINTLALTSATIASFSLLTLQISTSRLYINEHLLIGGFIVLTLNTFWGLVVTRWAINSEEKPIRILSKVMQHQQLSENEKKAYKKMENNEYDVNSKFYGWGIYLNMFFLLIGLILIISSFFIKTLY